MEFLNDVAAGRFSGKRAVAFGIQVKMITSGNATKDIEKKLKNLSFTVFKQPLVVYVESKAKNVWQFKLGELEKAIYILTRSYHLARGIQ